MIEKVINLSIGFKIPAQQAHEKVLFDDFILNQKVLFG